MNKVIVINDLSKQYGLEKALKNISLTVEKGAIYGLVGNNGAGKSTLLKILSGHTFASSGAYELFGENTEAGLRQARKLMGTMIETPCFYPHMTVYQNLNYYRIQRGIPNKNMVQKVLEEVGLHKQVKKKFKNLSMGMKQRLGIALALMSSPELLILDEPINGLDPAGIIEIRNLLLKLNREREISILISSHILTELSNVATHYGFLNKGVLVESLSAQQLEVKCQNYLEVKVTDTSKLSALIEQKFNSEHFRVIDKNVIQVFDQDIKPEMVSDLTAAHGIGLTGLNEQAINLEDYYMSLVGGEHSA